MSVIQDRTRQDTRAGLVAWHAEETNELLKAAADTFFLNIDPLIDAHGEHLTMHFFRPFLDALEVAADQFDQLYRLVTDQPSA